MTVKVLRTFERAPMRLTWKGIGSGKSRKLDRDRNLVRSFLKDDARALSGEMHILGKGRGRGGKGSRFFVRQPQLKNRPGGILLWITQFHYSYLTVMNISCYNLLEACAFI